MRVCRRGARGTDRGDGAARRARAGVETFAESGGVNGLRRHRAIASLFAAAVVLVVSLVAGTLVGIAVFVLYLLLLTAQRPRS